MDARVLKQSMVLADGLQFEWTYDDAGMVEVWHWRFGRKWVEAHRRDPGELARELAYELIAEKAQLSSDLGAADYPRI